MHDICVFVGVHCIDVLSAVLLHQTGVPSVLNLWHHHIGEGMFVGGGGRLP